MPNKRYIFPLLSLLLILSTRSLVSCEVEDDTTPTNVVEDTTSLVQVKNITPYSAFISGTFIEDASVDNPDEVGIRYSLQNTRFISSTGTPATASANDDGSHSLLLEELYSDTTYYFKTYYKIGDTQYNGSSTYSFHTHELTATTDSATNIYAFGATFGLKLSEEIDPAKFKGSYGVYYSTRPIVSTREYSTLVDSPYVVTNLMSDYDYYYQAFVMKKTATQQEIYTWGEKRQLHTPALSVETVGDECNTPFSVTLQGSVNVLFDDVLDMGFLLFTENREITLDSVDTSSDQTIYKLDPTAYSSIGWGDYETYTETLQPKTNYYYRAFATINKRVGNKTYTDTYYGDIRHFRTSIYSVTEADEIDMGLSVIWASKNVGAENIQDVGDYFSYNQRESITSSNGWRRPTYDEAKELVDSCHWTWYTYQNQPGALISAKNGNTIFLPANQMSGSKYTYGIYMQADSVNVFSSIEYIPTIRFIQDDQLEQECGKQADNMVIVSDNAVLAVRLVKEQ